MSVSAEDGKIMEVWKNFCWHAKRGSLLMTERREG